MNIAFDNRRDLATNSVEYPSLRKPGTTPRDSIKILEDTDGDGRADTVKTFVDGLIHSDGLLPMAGADGGCVAYSYSHRFYRFTDRTETTGPTPRDVCTTGFCGPCRHARHVSSYTWVTGSAGFNATHGFSKTTSEVKGSDGHVVKMNSGNTYRFRPDGSRDRTVDVGASEPIRPDIRPLGKLVFGGLPQPSIMMLLRGAHYQSFGKPHDGLGFGPEICTHEHGSTAIAASCITPRISFPRNIQIPSLRVIQSPIGSITMSSSSMARHFKRSIEPISFRATTRGSARRSLKLGAGWRTLCCRLLQQDHRPLRGTVDASRPRPRARAHMADCPIPGQTVAQADPRRAGIGGRPSLRRTCKRPGSPERDRSHNCHE